MKKIILLILLISMLPLATASALTVKEVAKEIKMVDCNMLVSVCRTQAAADMRGRIKEMIDQGMTKQEILDQFVEEYGEQVRAAPAKEGFNLIAWVTPFITLLAGAIFLYVSLRRWAFPAGTTSAAHDGAVSEQEIEAFQEEIETERKKHL